MDENLITSKLLNLPNLIPRIQTLVNTCDFIMPVERLDDSIGALDWTRFETGFGFRLCQGIVWSCFWFDMDV